MTDNLDYDGGNWAVEWIAAHPTSELARLTMGDSAAGYAAAPAAPTPTARPKPTSTA